MRDMRADVLGSTATGGELRLNLGYVADGAGISSDATVWGPWGFVSRPAPPGDGFAARCWYSQDGNQKRVFGFLDLRFADRVGALAEGDSCIYTDGEARILVKQASDSVTLYTVNQTTDKSMMVTASGADGTLTLLNGNAFISVEDDKITLAVNGGGSLVIDADGVKVMGATFDCATGGGRLGVLACQAPVTPATGIAAGAGVAATPSTKWSRDP